MAAFSNFLEQALLEYTLNGGATGGQSTVFIALFTDASTDDDSSTEVGGGLGYARQSVAGGDWTIADAGGGQWVATNDNDIEFGPNTVSDWGAINGIGVYDLVSGGNLLYHGTPTSVRTVQVGDVYRINAGSFTIELR